MKDKIFFWIDSEILYFCLAYYLQTKHDCDIYAIIDITNRPKKFFEEQKLVKFKKTWYLHDYIDKKHKKPNIDFLSAFEKKYNIHLWQLAINERIFYRFNKFYKFSSNEILSILEQECKLFEEVLDEVKPDFFITKQTIFHKDQIFFQMCRERGIQVLMSYPSKTVAKCIISQELHKMDSPENLEVIKGKNRNFDDLQKYLKSFDRSKELSRLHKKFTSSKSKKLKAAFEFLILSENKNVETHYTYYGHNKARTLKDSIHSSLNKKRRKSFIDKNLLTEIDHDENFIYFPLLVDVERENLIAAPFYTNHIEVIRHIVKSLPIGYKLYVKEHPGQGVRNWRSISEYKEIMNIPNVLLFHPSVPSEKLYKKCSLVITIGGTAGFEAAIYQKPSIIFVDLGYSILPSVVRVKSFEELSGIIRSSLKITVSASDLDKYITLLEKNSFDFDWFGFQIKEFEHFFYGGHLEDVEIPVSKMKSFLEENKDMLEQFTAAHLKKIKQIIH